MEVAISGFRIKYGLNWQRVPVEILASYNECREDQKRGRASKKRDEKDLSRVCQKIKPRIKLKGQYRIKQAFLKVSE